MSHGNEKRGENKVWFHFLFFVLHFFLKSSIFLEWYSVGIWAFIYPASVKRCLIQENKRYLCTDEEINKKSKLMDVEPIFMKNISI